MLETVCVHGGDGGGCFAGDEPPDGDGDGDGDGVPLVGGEESGAGVEVLLLLAAGGAAGEMTTSVLRWR